MIKKISALVLCFAFTLTLASCKTTTEDIVPETTTYNSVITETSEQSAFAEQTTTLITEATTSVVTTAETTTKRELNTSEIVALYINAADKSASSIKSTQKISLKDFSINNGEGAVNNVLKFVKPIISKVVESNSTEFDGITGGYKNMVVSDIKNATAYEKNGNTIIKLTMNEQNDNTVGDINSGSVGHAISVIGDLSVVFNQLSDSGLPINITNDNISMTYTNPTVNVTVDSNNNIVNGTWSYDVTIVLSEFTVGSSTVGNASVVINNKITFNSGFSE